MTSVQKGMNRMNDITKCYPNNPEAETSIIGSMLLDNNLINIATEQLEKDDFYVTTNQILFQTISDLYDKEQQVDLVTLKDSLNARLLLEKVGGVCALMEIEEAVPIPTSIKQYIKIVKAKAFKRNLIKASIDMQKQALDDTQDTKRLLEHAEKLFFSLTKEEAPDHEISSVLQHTFSDIESRANMHGLSGLSTGFIELDKLTSGLQVSDLIIIASRPSMGKTSFALNIAEFISNGYDKYPVAIFSLEMSKQQVVQNIIGMHARIDARLMRIGQLEDNEWERLAIAIGNLSEAPIFIDDTSGLNVIGLKAKARQLKLKYDIRLIIIDYLQLMESRKGENRQQEISNISRGLKALARELKVPVIAISQLNRSVENREGHKLKMSDLRESGSIEQDADVIILMKREDYYEENPKPKCITEFNIVKQRNGPIGNISLVFIKNILKFENV